MNRTHIEIYRSILQRVYALLEDNQKEDPSVVISYCFYARAIYISYALVTSQLTRKVSSVSELIEWIGSHVSKNCRLINILTQAPDCIVELFKANDIPVFTGDISTLYQELLENSVYDFGESNNLHRKELGSYYTPPAMAKTLTCICLKKYIENNGIESIFHAKIADFSCGSGVFLLEALAYISSLKKMSSKEQLECKIQVAKNLYGFDVDCIVLDIAMISILSSCKFLCSYDELRKNFRHCNFLINSSFKNDENDAIDAYSKGYIYNKALSVDISSLPQYDIILGNPPWEKIRHEDKLFSQRFKTFGEGIAYKNYKTDVLRDIDRVKKQIKTSVFFQYANIGELNTYALFTKAAQKLLKSTGVCGLIVKSSLVTSYTYSLFFKSIVTQTEAIYDFTNRDKYFNIDSRERFCLLVFKGSPGQSLNIAMNLRKLDDINSKSFGLDVNNLKLINPETRTLPNVENGIDFLFLLKIYKENKIFSQEFPLVKYGRLVHFTLHKEHIIKQASIGYIPIYEGKFISHYDARYSGFNNVPYDERYKNKAVSNPISINDKLQGVVPESRYFIEEGKWHEISKHYKGNYMLAWHSLTSASNKRTCVATVMPFMPTSQSIQFLMTENDVDLLFLTGLFNSAIFDYILKQKLNGIDLTRSVIDQMPVPSKKRIVDCNVIISNQCYSATSIIMYLVAELLSDDYRLSTLTSKYLSEKIIYCDRGQMLVIIDWIIGVLYNIPGDQIRQIITTFHGRQDLKFLEQLEFQYK